MSVKITSWNINSVRLRLDQLNQLAVLEQPDVICLQETKVRDELFPALEIAAMGYGYQHISGQKSYNGVAILSRVPFKAVGTKAWCGREDKRHAWVELESGLEIHNLYIPAGGDKPDPVINDKFAYKLSFLEELADWSRQLAHDSKSRVLLGDFNVAPLENDVWDHKKLLKIITHTEAEVTRLNKIIQAGGWVDSHRHLVPEPEKIFTWWSYRAGEQWRDADKGRRLDHIWVSEVLRQEIKAMTVLKEARGWDTPSDHAPVSLTLA